MEIKKQVLGFIETNCYILLSGNEVIVIDPGEASEKIVNEIGENSLKYIILTHYHFDHTRGVAFLRNKFKKAKVCIFEADKEYVEHFHDGFAVHKGKPDDKYSEIQKKTYVNFKVDKTLEDKEKLNFGSEELEVFHTPGHTPGSICLFTKTAVFSGDTIFTDGIGRTDLLGGDLKKMHKSLNGLKEKIKPGIRVYPGHGESFVWAE